MLRVMLYNPQPAWYACIMWAKLDNLINKSVAISNTDTIHCLIKLIFRKYCILFTFINECNKLIQLAEIVFCYKKGSISIYINRELDWKDFQQSLLFGPVFHKGRGKEDMSKSKQIIGPSGLVGAYCYLGK